MYVCCRLCACLFRECCAPTSMFGWNHSQQTTPDHGASYMVYTKYIVYVGVTLHTGPQQGTHSHKRNTHTHRVYRTREIDHHRQVAYSVFQNRYCIVDYWPGHRSPGARELMAKSDKWHGIPGTLCMRSEDVAFHQRSDKTDTVTQ